MSVPLHGDCEQDFTRLDEQQISRDLAIYQVASSVRDLKETSRDAVSQSLLESIEENLRRYEEILDEGVVIL